MKSGMRQVMEALSFAGNLGFTLVVNVLVGVLLGRMLDEWLFIAPWGVALGTVLGLLAGMRSVYYRVTMILSSEEEEEVDKENDAKKGN